MASSCIPPFLLAGPIALVQMVPAPVRVGSPPLTTVLPEDRPNALLVEYGVSDRDTITVQIKPATHLAVPPTPVSSSSSTASSSSSGSVQRRLVSHGQTLGANSNSSSRNSGCGSTAPASDPFHGVSPHDPAFWPTTFISSGRDPSNISQAGPSQVQPRQGRPRKVHEDSPDPEPSPGETGGTMLDLIREILPSAGTGEGGAGSRAIKPVKRPRNKGEAVYNHVKELKKVNAVPKGAKNAEKDKKKTIVGNLWDSDLMAEVHLGERESFFNRWAIPALPY